MNEMTRQELDDWLYAAGSALIYPRPVKNEHEYLSPLVIGRTIRSGDYDRDADYPPGLRTTFQSIRHPTGNEPEPTTTAG